ncbi:retrovirus-related pol polyprotein from transposon TNT 1-94 [Tanacetum coccineum]
MDENEVVIKNKARLKAIRIFLAYASYMGFMVYQIDVKSAFLNGKISEEVYVQQPPGYLKGTPNLGLWYLKGLGFDLKAYSDLDYAGCNLDWKTEAEYVAAAGCCAQVLWIKMLHSRTKHIDIRYHFIRDHILKGDIKLHFIPTDMQLADIFTKPLAELSFTRLVAELGKLNIKKEIPDKKKALSDPRT